MGFFIDIFNTILYQPLLNILVVLYTYLPGQDFGIAVIVLTVLVKLVFYPLGSLAIKSQKNLSTLQPKIKELQEKYKDNKEKQMKAVMELYKKEKVNPFSGCLPILVQLPVLIALYQVFRIGFQEEQVTNALYSFISNPGALDPSFLGLVDLSGPNTYIAILAGSMQYIQVKMSLQKTQQKEGKKPDFANIMQKQMLYFFPVFTVFILFGLPSAIGLYWVVTTLFSIGQQYVIFKKSTPS